MKLTNEQKKTAIKRVLIAGAIFTVGAVLKKTYDCGYDKGFNDALHIPHEAYKGERIIAKEVDGKVVISVDDLSTYFNWNDSKGTLDKGRG